MGVSVGGRTWPGPAAALVVSLLLAACAGRPAPAGPGTATAMPEATRAVAAPLAMPGDGGPPIALAPGGPATISHVKGLYLDRAGDGWVWSWDGVSLVRGLRLQAPPVPLPSGVVGILGGAARNAEDLSLIGATGTGEVDLHTADGISWASHPLPTTSGTDRLAVTPDAARLLLTTGLVAGRTVPILLHSADAGVTWGPVLGAPAAVAPLPAGANGIAFADADRGWITATEPADAGPLLFATTDGGVTWTGVSLPVPPGLSGVETDTAQPLVTTDPPGLLVPATVHRGTRVGFLVYRHTASGWTDSPVLTAPVPSPHYVWSFLDARHGLLIAERLEPAAPALVYATADGGQTWTLVGSSTALNEVDDLAMVSPTAAAGAGARAGQAFVIRTEDGGRTWTT